MPAQLVALTGGSNILLDKPILLLGRHPECDIQLESRKISRRHCCIAQVHDYLVVRDLGSTNGIRINGVRVLEGKLRTGDELTIGNFRYQITWDAYNMAPAKEQPRVEAVEEVDARPVATSKPMEDDVLESCDEPVPLNDEGPAAGPVAVPVRGPSIADQSSSSDEKSAPDSAVAPRPRKEESAVSFVLPDNLELAPASDEYPRQSSQNGHS